MKQYLSENTGVLLLAALLMFTDVLVLILIFKGNKANSKENIIFNIFYGNKFFSNPFIPFILPCGLIVLSIIDHFLNTSYLAVFIIGWFQFVILNRLLGKIMKNKFVTFTPEGKTAVPQNTEIINYYKKKMKYIYTSLFVITFISFVIFIGINLK